MKNLKPRDYLISGDDVAAEDLKIIGKPIGNRIIELRKINKITQKKLSLKTKIPLKTISLIENGKRIMSINEVKSIAKNLKTSPEFILSGL